MSLLTKPEHFSPMNMIVPGCCIQFCVSAVHRIDARVHAVCQCGLTRPDWGPPPPHAPTSMHMPPRTHPPKAECQSPSACSCLSIACSGKVYDLLPLDLYLLGLRASGQPLTCPETRRCWQIPSCSQAHSLNGPCSLTTSVQAQSARATVVPIRCILPNPSAVLHAHHTMRVPLLML